MWILPFAFYPWAADAAPQAFEAGSEPDDDQTTPSRPWVIFAGLGLLPLIDYGLRRAAPVGPLDAFHDLSTAVAIVSVLPLLMARLAVERAELRQVDAQLRLLAAAIEQADEQILIVAGDDRVHHANDAFCRATGYSGLELKSIDPPRLLAEESAAKQAELRQSLREGRVWRGTLVRQRKDGSVYQASSTVVPLADARGEFTHFVRIEHDITDELRMRDQLIHSERLSAVGQLISGVAHELNNPLQSILGFTELLMDAEDRPGLRRDLEQVRSEAVRAGKIVRNLLAFARRSPAERSLCNINDIVRTTLALRSYEFGSANIHLEEHYAEEAPPVLVNREEIQQVVLNLVLNAEQAIRSARQGGTLTIATQFTEGREVVVEVKDEGPGVPAELAGRVFEPFFSTKEVGEGTGLGLSIAMGIAQAHGGSLKLVPTSIGACFRLTLPAVEAVESVQKALASAGERA
jgi:two-component system NtrC family sensor kinase